MKRIFFVLMACLFLFGCNKKNDIGVIDKISVDNSVQTDEMDNIEIINDDNLGLAISGQEFKEQFTGTLYKAMINDDSVNVRDLPSLEANSVLQLDKNTEVTIIGVSKEKELIDSYNGLWLCIKGNYKGKWVEQGWVFSKYVNMDEIEPSIIQFEEFIPETERKSAVINVSYNLNGNKVYMKMYPYKNSIDNYYTFVLDYWDDDYHYSNIPGSYIWYPDTNELKHITYMGTSMESGWVDFTDDFEYFIEDFGTGPAPRGIGVWRVFDKEEIFRGSYYRDINLHGHFIEVIYHSNWWSYYSWKYKPDDELINYFEQFKQENPEPEEMLQYSRETRLGLELIVFCEINLDTGVRKILRGQYIHTQ
jgi:hypothetical protein